MCRAKWVLLGLAVVVLHLPGCERRAGRVDELVDLVELREAGVLSRFLAAPTEGALMDLDPQGLTRIVWGAALRAPAGATDSGKTGDGVPLRRTVLDWAWDGPVLRINDAVYAARLPDASPEDAAAARMIIHKGCPAAAGADLPCGAPDPQGRVLVVEDCEWTEELFAAVAPRFRRLVIHGGTIPPAGLSRIDPHTWRPTLLAFEALPLEASFLESLAPHARDLVALSFEDTGLSFAEGSVDVLNGMGSLRSLDLSGTKIRGEDLRCLASRGPLLEELHLGSTYLTPAQMEKVSKIRSLRILDLSNSRANGTSLERLDDLPALRRLDLRATAVEDPGMAELAGLTNLVELHTSFWLTDGSGPHLGTLTGLRVLRIRATRLKTSGLSHLSALTELVELELSHVHMDDQGLMGVLPAPGLEILEMEDTAVGDIGAAELGELAPDLRILKVHHTRITEDALARLGEKLSNTTIIP